MKFLVTGAAGFVGSSIVDRLLTDDSNQVIGLDAFTDYYDPDLKKKNLRNASNRQNFRLVEEKIQDADLQGLLRDVDVVIHQAGQPGVRKSWGTGFSSYTSDNINATQQLQESAKTAGIRKFIYASSSSIYGDAESYPTKEDALPRPYSPYGVSKLSAEHLCNLYAKNFDLPTISLRYFTVYGPRQRPDMAFNRFIRAAYSGDEINVYGDGSQIRDFTYIDDVVSANLLAASSSAPPGTVVNISGGSSVTVNEVLDIIETQTGCELRVRRGAFIPGDVYRTGGDSSLAAKLLNWSPKVTIESGLAKQCESIAIAVSHDA